jgi:hypothetical protein
MRSCNKEIHIFDTKKSEWLKDFINISKERDTPSQRANHASAVFMNYLIIHGGINTNNKAILNDIYFYNIDRHQWVEVVQKEQIENQIW